MASYIIRKQIGGEIILDGDYSELEINDSETASVEGSASSLSHDVQLIYLDFDGAETRYHNRDLGLDFAVTVADSGFSDETKQFILSELSAAYSNIVFTLDKPEDDAVEYSTVYIGKSDDFREYGNFYGLAETIDAGNQIRNDNAFVLLDSNSDLSQVISVTDHELGHIVYGQSHDTFTGTCDDYAYQVLGKTNSFSDQVVVAYSQRGGLTNDQKTVKVSLSENNAQYAVISIAYTSSSVSDSYGMITTRDLRISKLGSGVDSYIQKGKTYTDTVYIDTNYLVTPSFRCYVTYPLSLTIRYDVDIQYYTTVPAPDLQVSSISCGRDAADGIIRFAPDESFTLTFTIRNTGDGPAGASTAAIYDGTTCIATVNTDSLAEGSSKSYTYTFAAGSLGKGSHSLSVKADNSNVISEINNDGNAERNNSRSLTQIVIADRQADLTVGSFSLVSDAEDGVFNTLSPISVSAVITNISPNGKSAASQAVLYMDGNAVASADVSELEPGAKQTVSLKVAANLLAEGKHTFKLAVDPDGKIGEYNEDNNEVSKEISIKKYLPDLTVKDFSIAAADGGVIAWNSAIKISATVQNLSPKAAAPETVIWLYMDDIRLQPVMLPGLEINGSTKIDLTLPADFIPTGKHEFKLVADPDGRVREEAEDNNTASTEVAVEANLPDLVIAGVDGNFGSSYVTRDTVINFTVRNDGLADAAASVATICIDNEVGVIDRPEPYSARIAEIKIDPLKAGESKQYSFTISAGELTGNGKLRIALDAGKFINETHEENNIVEKYFSIGGPQVHDDHLYTYYSGSRYVGSSMYVYSGKYTKYIYSDGSVLASFQSDTDSNVGGQISSTVYNKIRSTHSYVYTVVDDDDFAYNDADRYTLITETVSQGVSANLGLGYPEDLYPDLVVSSWSTESNLLFPGGTTLRFTIKNQGGTGFLPYTNVQIRSGETVLDALQIPYIAGGESADFEYTFLPGTLPFGTHDLTLVIDTGNQHESHWYRRWYNNNANYFEYNGWSLTELSGNNISNIGKVNIIAPAGYIDNSAVPEVTVTASAVSSGRVTLTANVKDSVGLVKTQYRIGLDGTWLDYTAPVAMNTNGMVYFRAVNKAGNEGFAAHEVNSFAVMPPTVTANTAAPTNRDVILTAACGSMAMKQYSLDNSQWQTYTDGVTMSSNGTVWFRSFDGLGNVSEAVSYTVTNIDKVAPEAPTASADITTPTNQDVTVTATFSDDSAQKQYSLDGQNFLAYDNGVVMQDNGTAYFRGIDAAGNISDITSLTVSNIDKEAPEAPNASADITTPTNQDVTVTATFSDDSAQKQYSLDGQNFLAYDNGVVMQDNGTVYFLGIDEAGNASEVTSYDVTNIDKVAPEAPAASADITAPTNQNVTVTATFSDDSAVREYSLDGQNFLAYEDGVVMEDNGTVYFRGTDAVGNISAVTSYEVSNIITAIPDSVTGDLNGDGRADIVMSITEVGHGAEGATGAWLIQEDQLPVWGNLSQRDTGWVVFGMGKTAAGKNTNDVYIKNQDNIVGAWTTDDSGLVTGWETISSELPGDAQVLGLGDFNGNGQSDLLLRAANGAVGCFFADGQGWNYFQSLGDEWKLVAIGDLNGDGRDDVVLKHDAGFAGSWLIQEDGTPMWADLDTLPEGFEIVGAGDFNGDGTDDVLLKSGGYYGAWLVQNGNAAGWFGLGDLGDATVEQISDFNGDGVADLRIRTAAGDLGAELVMGADTLEWKYYGSVGSEWSTGLAALS